MKTLVKKKDGSVHIRAKSNESAENLENVAPTKVATWLALSEASHNAAGKTMEDIIQAVIDECRGGVFKEEKERVPVTQEEYDSLLLQCLKKKISKNKLDSLVVVVSDKESELEEQVTKILLKIRQ